MSGNVWMAQLRAVARVELRRYRRSRRWIAPVILALLPIALMLASVLIGFQAPYGPMLMRRVPIEYGAFFQNLWLRFMIFFSCAFLFSQLFRSELLEKTLHHYYLVPIRRDAVVLGKFLTTLIASVLLFSTATAMTYFLFFWPASEGREFLLTPVGISHMGRYVAIAALSCASYGALFLLIGLIFRNPMIPALFVLCWETFTYFLPSLFQHLSFTLYLHSLMPVTILNGPFDISVEPPAPIVSAVGLLGASAGLVWFSSFLVKRIQITYTAD
jgi:ABC-type transport system involved in multi-copper enzyme maturation permease subunit